jgi:type I restriction enzyme, S subunit
MAFVVTVPANRLMDSGVDWIGAIPSHWRTTPLISLASERNKSNRGLKEDNLLSLSFGKIIRKDISTKDGLLPESFETYQIVEAGDIVWRLTDLQNDKRSLRTAIVVERGIITSAYLATVPFGINPRYLAYQLRAYDLLKVFYSMGGGLRQSMKFSDVRRLPIVLPPPDEQAIIVEWLDSKTAYVENLIQKKRQLLKRLEERRLAIIDHTVMKGRRHDVRMKESGVRWIGEIPEHWSLKKIKYAVSHVVDCLHTTPTYDGELRYPAVRTADIERGVLLLDQIRLVSEEIYTERIQRLRPQAGDILYSREGERFGLAALVPDGVDICLGQRMMMFRTLEDISSSYLMWALNSQAIFQQVILYTGGATSPHINIGDIINFHIPCPPYEEQVRIGSYLAAECSKIDAAMAKLREGIERLEEYQSAITIDAVTGKIDLRSLGDKEVAA